MATPRNTYWNRPWLGFELGISDNGGSRHRREQNGYSSDPSVPAEWVNVYPYHGRTSTTVDFRPFLGSPPLNTFTPTPYYGQFHPVVSSSFPGWTECPAATNKAFARLLDEVYGDSSSLGTTLAEGREAFTLIADRCSRIYRSYKALKRGQFQEFLKHLSVSPKRKHRSIKRTLGKEASGLWLEYWFGWAPMASDIFESAVVLTDTLGQGWISAQGSAKQGVNHSEWFSVGSGDYGMVCSTDVVVIVKQGGDFRIENPNAALLTKLGMNNPASIAWELMPFSFVVDWFTNVGDVLNAYTALFGFEWRRPYTMSYVKGLATMDMGRFPGRTASVTWRINHHDRYPDLTRTLVEKPRLLNFTGSHTRAVTAASLMAQILVSD